MTKVLFVLLMLCTPAFFVFAHEGAHTTPLIVEINDTEGFVPQELEVYQGDTVLFRNTGEYAHWPASDIHPTHQAYPGSSIQKCGSDEEPYIFDACREMLPGEEWGFLFEDAGVWNMHDHLFPSFVGTITVREDKNYIPTKKPLLSQTNIFINSLYDSIALRLKRLYARVFPGYAEKRFAEVNIFEIARDEHTLRYWMEELGPEKIMERLVDESGGGSEIDCHTEAHYTGRIAYEVYGAELFERGNSACHSGYYHGGMEGFLADKGTDDIAQNIEKICSSFGTSFGVFECLHGVGHGVMAYERYDMPKALELCGQLATPFDQNSCYGGVFMENIVAGQGQGALSGHDTGWVSYDDLHYPCNAVSKDPDVQVQCYQMQTSWMLTVKNYDFDAVAEDCLRAPQDMVSVCFLSLGRDAAGFTLREPAAIKEICEKVPHEYAERCIIGATNVIIDFWGDGLRGQASELCGVLEGENKSACWNLLAGRLWGVFGDSSQKREVCKTFEPSFQYLCAELWDMIKNL